MELFAQSVLQEIKAVNTELRKAIEGLTPEALNWKPTAADTNSLFVLGTHMVGVQRFMVALAANKTVQRDRAAEFLATGNDARSLLEALGQAEKEIEAWLDSLTPATFAEPRTYLNRQISAARCLAIALRHLGEHLGHAGLTRQLWEQARSS